ncbi:hypothetical protein [Hydrogenophaga crocea]|uniref:Uncharacterized protein n=1 Tax=Hydrogenophaga crocea TaxID=2716225 RepID=A0A6G8II53_9BURK|nr:hypothetical protein [Hydrogenophaga crocea]QIM52833.1 hypothetical protein G9Q37_12090 [Hydrogenophaga crocea]
MQVRVRPLRKEGVLLNSDDLKTRPPHIGRLRVAEERDPQLERPVTRAKLLDMSSGLETDVLPQLNDARLVYVKDGQWRLVGTERIRDAEYAQTWALEQMPC